MRRPLLRRLAGSHPQAVIKALASVKSRIAFTTKTSNRESEVSPVRQSAGMIKHRSTALRSLSLLLLGLMFCGSTSSDRKPLPPIIFVPGYGMGALHVEVEREGRPEANFNFLLPAMNPDAVFAGFSPPVANALDYARGSGLEAADVGFVRDWLKLRIDADGSARNRRGVRVRPVSIGRDFARECPRYGGMVESLVSEGWETNKNLACIPFDYRYPPGETRFAADLKNLIIGHV
ncbi:hypothetical protein [Synechococcus sp. MIT S9509]|uniref:hypothetical protein n=1 Tax=Synechococcus sp. MIT S9509 TaxID=1801630 RepID=UPI000A861D8D|nr:hypothetical protein [Synechococcus sp. MIT S9509]